MNIQDLIEDLIVELSYQSPTGVSNLKDRESIRFIYEYFSERGLSEVGQELINNLLFEEEDDKKFKNPRLNQVVQYQDDEGNEKEGLIGNLLRLKTDQPGREAAERALGNMSDEERQALNKELGGEGGGGEQSDTQPQGADGQDQKPQGGSVSPDTEDGKSYTDQLSPSDPAYTGTTDKKEDETPKGNGYTGNKNKTLRDTDPLKSEEYNRDLEPNDDEFQQRNSKYSNPIPPPPLSLDGIVQNPKFPKRYLKVLERMVNSKYTPQTKKWQHFSLIEGGAGLTPAQSGELMTMMGSTMSDDEWNNFKSTILDYEKQLIENNPNLKNPKFRIVDSSWVKSSDNNRKVILARLKKQYGNNTEVVAASWDSQKETEALGLENYKENKGFSTDMYLRVRKPNGEEVLDEISLKKSKAVNFLNSGAGSFFNWLDNDVPDEINQNVYRNRQREELVTTSSKLKDEILSLLESDSDVAKKLKDFYKTKGIEFEQALQETESGNGSRTKSNVILKSIQALADWPTWGSTGDKGPKSSGNPVAIQHLREVSEQQNRFIQDSIDALANNPKMKEGMLQTIREEFPLKAVSEGEETMAIGDMSLDKKTMNEIFGTSNYDEIKEKLVSEPGPPPFLGYRAEVGKDVIPIAEVSVREDGVGYGGQMKFEMKLDSRFAKKLEQATKKVYETL